MTDSYRSDGFSTFSLCAAVAVAADVHKPMPNCEAILIEDEEKINFFRTSNYGLYYKFTFLACLPDGKMNDKWYFRWTDARNANCN